MRNRLYITGTDCERLRRHIVARRGADSADHEYVPILDQELDRAEVV
jgi:hypothetical protein